MKKKKILIYGILLSLWAGLVIKDISIVYATLEENSNEETIIEEEETVIGESNDIELEEVDEDNNFLTGYEDEIEVDAEDNQIVEPSSIDDMMIDTTLDSITEIDSIIVPEGGKITLYGFNEYELYDSNSSLLESGVLSTIATIGNSNTSYTIELSENATITLTSIDAFQLSITGNSNSSLTVVGASYGIKSSYLYIENINLNISAQGIAIGVFCSADAPLELGLLRISNSIINASGTTVLSAERRIEINSSTLNLDITTSTDGLNYGVHAAAYISAINGDGNMAIHESSFIVNNKTTGAKLTHGIFLRGHLITYDSTIQLGEKENELDNGLYILGYSWISSNAITNIYAKQMGIMALQLNIYNQSQVTISALDQGIQLDGSMVNISVTSSTLTVNAVKNGLFVKEVDPNSNGNKILFSYSDILITSENELGIGIINGSLESYNSNVTVNTKTTENKAAIYFQNADLGLESSTLTIQNPLISDSQAKGIYMTSGSLTSSNSTLNVSSSDLSIITHFLYLDHSTITCEGGIAGLYISEDATVSNDSSINATLIEYGGDNKLSAIFVKNDLIVDGVVTASSPFEGTSGVVVLGNIQLKGTIESTVPYHNDESNNQYSAVYANWDILSEDALIIENYTKQIILDNVGKDMDADNPTMNDFRNFDWKITSGQGSVAIDSPKNILYTVVRNFNSSILSAQENNHQINYLNTLLTISYTLKFDMNYPNPKNILPNQIINSGTTVVEPETPTRQGYTFLGWYDEKDIQWYFEGTSNPTLMPENDVVLYAHWDKINNNTPTTPNKTTPPSDIVYTGISSNNIILYYLTTTISFIILSILSLPKRKLK